MTLTTRSMGWLNQNRRRAYPLVRTDWRRTNPPEAGRDAILLDAIVLDADAMGTEQLTLVAATVEHDRTTIRLRYGATDFAVDLTGGAVSGEGSFACLRGIVRGSGAFGATVTLVCSSHAYLLENLGEGSWTFDCPVLPSRVLSISDGAGVAGVETQGSTGVAGNETPRTASGDVVLEDGYRTSPIVSGGRVFVRVGRRYGLDPCHYDFGEASARDCRCPLFFFCGQNAINNGNIVLRGGRGISIRQGGTYEVNDPKSKANGKRIPCIEIVAGQELLDICRPEDAD